MKKTLCSLVFVLHFTCYAQPSFTWAAQMGESTWDGGNSIANDAHGNVYTTGQFAGAIDFDPGPGVHTLTCTSTSADIFISKLDAQGNFIWAKAIGGTRYNSAYALAIDAQSNVYITGTFIQNVDFDPGPGTYYINSYATLNDYSTFICKLDSAGNFIWARAIMGPYYDWGMAIAVDHAGNVYTAGCFQSTMDFDPGPGTYTLSSLGGDIFIQKMDPAGNFIWAKQISGWGRVYSLILDASANIYTAGYFYATMDFDPGPAVTSLTSYGWRDAFVNKLDSSGNFIWAKQAGGPAGNEEAKGLALGNGGELYVTGYFEDSMYFQNGNTAYQLNSFGRKDIFLWKLQTSGAFFWAKQLGSDSNDIAHSITTDPQGFVYVTGEFGDTVDFDPSPGVSNLSSAGRSDIFISKYNGIGKFVCAGKMGGKANDVSASVAIDLNGSIYTTGRFSDTADFDPGASAYDLRSVNNSIFVSKLDNCIMGVGENSIGGVMTEISLFPNPSSGMIFVRCPTEITRISVFSILGMPVQYPIDRNEIDLSAQPKGIYFVEIMAEGKKTVKKIILE